MATAIINIENILGVRAEFVVEFFKVALHIAVYAQESRSIEEVAVVAGIQHLEQMANLHISEKMDLFYHLQKSLRVSRDLPLY